MAYGLLQRTGWRSVSQDARGLVGGCCNHPRERRWGPELRRWQCAVAGQARVPEIRVQMAGPRQAPFREIKMSMRLHFVMGAKNGSTSRGQGHYQAVPVTLQLLNELAFQKGRCPFAMELHNLPSRKTALSQNDRPGLQISPVQQRGCLVNMEGCHGLP